MTEGTTESKETKPSLWQNTPTANLIRYIPTRVLFARIRVKGKLIRRSLKTKTLTVARLRLRDLETKERQHAEHNAAFEGGKMTFEDALAIFRQRLQGNASLKPRTKEHREERISVLLKTWSGLLKYDVRKITKQDCLNWSQGYKSSAINFNKTVQTLKMILEIPVESGIRYDNPSRFIPAMKVRVQPLHLPSRQQLGEIVKEVRRVNKRFSQDAANLIEFLAYGGYRRSEAQKIIWADCNFEKGEVLVRGDRVTGTKNWEIRYVPMFEKMRKLLEKLKNQQESEPSSEARVMQVASCNGALRSACLKLGIPYITHHDLRHLFATTCIESGVDIPTVSRWLGHKDGGALAMKTYGHLRNEHSQAMAQKVKF